MKRFLLNTAAILMATLGWAQLKPFEVIVFPDANPDVYKTSVRIKFDEPVGISRCDDPKDCPALKIIDVSRQHLLASTRIDDLLANKTDEFVFGEKYDGLSQRKRFTPTNLLPSGELESNTPYDLLIEKDFFRSDNDSWPKQDVTYRFVTGDDKTGPNITDLYGEEYMEGYPGVPAHYHIYKDDFFVAYYELDEHVYKGTGYIYVTPQNAALPGISIDVKSDEVVIDNYSEYIDGFEIEKSRVRIIATTRIQSQYQSTKYDASIDPSALVDKGGNSITNNNFKGIHFNHGVNTSIDSYITIDNQIIEENNAKGATVANVNFYSIYGSDEYETFKIVSSTYSQGLILSGRELKLINRIDYEKTPSFEVVIEGTNFYGTVRTDTFQITVKDIVDEEVILESKSPAYMPLIFPGATLPSKPSRLELRFNQPPVVGTGKVYVYKGGSSFPILAIDVEVPENIDIQGNDLVIQLPYALEPSTDYSVIVPSTAVYGFEGISSGNWKFKTKNEIVPIDGPSGVILSDTVIMENQFVAFGLSATDYDFNQTLDRYSFYMKDTIGDNAYFQIFKSPFSNDYSFSNKVKFDYETKKKYFVTIVAEDQNGKTYEELIEIAILDDTNENVAPNNISLFPFMVGETSILDSKLATFTVNDPNINDTHTFMIVGGDDADLFYLEGNELKNADTLSFEKKSVLKIRVRATDDRGLFLEKDINVNLLKDFSQLNGGVVPQVLTYDVISDKDLKESGFAFSATSNSGLPVEISVVSGPAVYAGGKLYLTNTGIVKLKISQGGSAVFAAVKDEFISFDVTDKTVTSTEEVNNIISVYPNPTSGLVYFADNSSYKLTSATGIVLFIGNGSSVDLSSLDAGVYFLNIDGNTIQLVKE